MLQYDPFLRLADTVMELLAGSGPLKAKEIVRALHRRGWGKPPASAVNKVLTQYLANEVEQIESGRWSLKR